MSAVETRASIIESFLTSDSLVEYIQPDRKSAQSTAPDYRSIHRLACYIAANSPNEFTRTSVSDSVSAKWLLFINGSNYFEKRISFQVSSQHSIEKDFDMITMSRMNREHGVDNSISNATSAELPKQAYFLVVHMEHKNIEALVDSLDDGKTPILLHVDKTNQALHESIRSRFLGKNNVFVMEQTFYVSWGHSSIVEAPLEEFFQLLDICDEWDKRAFAQTAAKTTRQTARPSQGAAIIHGKHAKVPASTWMRDSFLHWRNRPRQQNDATLRYHPTAPSDKLIKGIIIPKKMGICDQSE